MKIIREYIAPLVALIIFLFALVAVSARIFSPNDLAAPAPVEEFTPPNQQAFIWKGRGVLI